MSSSYAMTNDFFEHLVVCPTPWRREGRGRAIEFVISAADLTSLLARQATKHDADWTLIACRRERDGETHRQISKVIQIPELPLFVAEGWWQFFLWSSAMSLEVLNRLNGGVSETALSLSGLINIQCGRRSRLGAAKSAIGIVEKVRNVDTGEVFAHKEQVIAFQALSKSIEEHSKTGT